MRRVLLLASCLALPSLAMLRLQGSSQGSYAAARAGGPGLARSGAFARPAVSFVVGPAEAPTGGELVVGLLVPSPVPTRLADLAPPGTWERFLKDGGKSAPRALGPVAEVEEDSPPPSPATLPGTERLAAVLSAAATSVTERARVHVSFRPVLAPDVEGLALVLVCDPILAGDRPFLRAARSSGTRVQCVRSRDPEFPDACPAWQPDDPKVVGPLVDLVLDTLRTSRTLLRLPVDPLEVVHAEREGDDVVVRLRAAPTTASLRTLDDREVLRIVPLADGTLRVPFPDPGIDARAHRIVARAALTGAFAGRELGRAFTLAELVGAADRRVLAPNVAEAGAAYAPRVVYANSKTGLPIAGIPDRLALLIGETIVAEARGMTDSLGLLDARLSVPEDVPAGPARLLVGDDAFPIEIRSGVRVCVVTDRPLYQPTDVVHARVMVHRAATGRPVVGAEVTLRCGEGTRRVTTSPHGIASAEFRLVGAQSVRSNVEATVAGATARAPFIVSAFETPSFTVACDPAQVRFQGDEGTPLVVVATYVNGSPMVGAKVSIDLVARVGIEPREGLTDARGRASFQAFGRGFRVGPSLRVRVEDVDGRVVELPIFAELDPPKPARAPEGLDVEALDEPVIGLPGRFELRGRGPGPVTVSLPGEAPIRIDLDAEGRGSFVWTPSGPEVIAGFTQSSEAPFERTLWASSLSPADRLMVRPARRVATVGETLDLEVFGPDGTAFVELARDSTVLRTRLVRVSGGSVRLTFPLDADLGGVLRLRAGRDDTTSPSGSQVAVLVSRGRSLRVTAQATAESWRPGETATVDVEVTDRSGRPTSAVLGYWGVDEALLALEPMIDGQEDAFDTFPRGALPAVTALATARERGLPGEPSTFRAALGPIEPLEVLPSELDVVHRSGLLRAAAVRRSTVEAFRGAVLACRTSVASALGARPPRELATTGSLLGLLRTLVREGRLDPVRVRDPWGTPFHVGRGLTWVDPTDPSDDEAEALDLEMGVEVRSAGPDLRIGTDDDLVMAWAPLAPNEIAAPAGPWMAFVLRAIETGLTNEGLSSEEAFATPYAEEFEGPSVNTLIGLGGASGALKRGSGHRNLRAGGGGSGARDPVHVRTDFSPTLCFVPEAIVGPDGKARLELPLRDAITMWRMRFVASAADGATGVGETRLRVTQPLHIEPHVPGHLTVGDELELPVAVRNETALDVTPRVRIAVSDELEVVGAPDDALTVPPGRTGVVVFRVRAVGPGRARVSLDAASAGGSDAIERTIVVRRNAREVAETTQGSIDAEAAFVPSLPAATPSAATEHRATLYPSPLTDLVGGFEGLIAAPHGCFEQTSATLHPMVLALRYMQKTGQVQPDLADRARAHVRAGAERLATFEVPGSQGGFSLWGHGPASLALTASAHAEYRDLAEVHAVDPALRARIASWLLGTQREDGSFHDGDASSGEVPAPAANGVFELTAYVAWSLSRAGAPSAAAVRYLSSHAEDALTPYGMALAALALLTPDPRSVPGHALLDRLVLAQESDVAGPFWRTSGSTLLGSRGSCASIETTALAIQALVKGGRHPGLAAKAVERLVAWRGSDGRFGTTQSTILALDALLCVENSAPRGDLEVTVRAAGRDRVLRLDAGSTEPLHVELPASGGGDLAFHAAGVGRARVAFTRTTFVPWSSPRPGKGSLALDVSWPTDVLPAGQIARANVSVRNDSTTAVARAVTLEIGIPPGCDVDPRDVRNSVAVRVERAPTSVVIYLEDLPAGESADFVIPFRPRYAIDVLTAPSKAYEYYVPEEAVEVEPARVRAAR